MNTLTLSRVQCGRAAKRLMPILLIAVLFYLAAGCAEPAPLEPARNVPESAAYVEAGAQAAIQTLMDLTCRKYSGTGVCAEAGRPLHPGRSQGYLDQLSKARAATRAASTMDASGGLCLGQPSTPAACIELASSMLTDIQRIIGSVK